MYEVEQKFHVDQIQPLVDKLTRLEANEQASQSHRDTYFNHPCRDFVETREALRVRRIDDIPSVTYKGSLVPGAIKARRELEWRLDPGDPDGENMEALFTLLGFRRVATVEKTRRTFTFTGKLADFTVVIDQVKGLGDFAEIELIVPGSQEIEAAARPRRIAELLGNASRIPARRMISVPRYPADARTEHCRYRQTRPWEPIPGDPKQCG